MAYNFPHSPKPIATQKLVFPYIKGTGHDFGSITIFYDGVLVPYGSVIKTDKDDLLRVIDTYRINDYFESVCVAICAIVGNHPSDKIDLTAREFSYQYSVYSGNI